MKLFETYQPKLLSAAKIILVAGTLGFIVYKLFFAYDIQNIVASSSFTWTTTNIILLASVFILVIPNIALEGRKWMLTMRQYEPVRFIQAIKSVTAGIALGIITPNRVGDFAGKALFLQSYDKIKGAVVSFIGSIAQTLSIIFCGSFGLWTLAFQQGYISSTLFYAGLFALPVLLALLFYVYINIHWLHYIIRWKKAKPFIDAFTHYTGRELSSLFLLSMLRFGIFNFQYFLLLHFFGVPIAAADAFPALFAIFVVQAFVPSFILIEMGVRGATALFFLGLFSTNSSGILLAAYTLWIINIMLPGLMGLFFILKLKWRSAA
ncbi:MAG: lysylphosphatidylglycerol synthase domain-containing protein [Bacteroidota bacterium]